MILPGVASAAGLLDFMRSYDLNDYSLGIAFSASQDPYLGGGTNAYPYPYLTTFRDPAFTRDWVLLSEGNVGFRFVTKSDWVFGLVGRVQTLGIGYNDAPELRGLSERPWTIEVAPMIGYRGWPLHIDARTYFEPLDRHEGTVSELTLRWPAELGRGFLVPSVRAIYRNAAYTNHYFGVSPGEAEPGRPEYTPGSATSIETRLRLGYAVSDRWLLTGTIGVEFLGTEITDSPIVERDRTWFGSVGFAYNADIFRPRYSETGKRQPRFEVRVAAFGDNVDSTIVRNAPDGTPGDVIDVEDLLGVSDRETVYQFETIFRFNPYHRLEIGYHELTRRGSVTLDRNLAFGGNTFPEASVVDSRVDSEVLRFGYAYSLMNDHQKELGVMAGVHVTSAKTVIASPATGDEVISDVSTPLPVIGLHGAVSLGPNSALAARAQAFAMEFDRFEGHMIYLMLEWHRYFGENLSAGVAYNYYRTHLDSTAADVQGSLRTTHHGPVLFVSAAF